MNGAAVRRAQERLALHELLRIGLGRQEDLRLLQNVGQKPMAALLFIPHVGGVKGMPGTTCATPPLRMSP